MPDPARFRSSRDIDMSSGRATSDIREIRRVSLRSRWGCAIGCAAAPTTSPELRVQAFGEFADAICATTDVKKLKALHAKLKD